MIIKGTFIDAPTPSSYRIRSGYAIYNDNRLIGIFDEIPSLFDNMELIDYSGKIIIPGMSDLHLHAPQYSYCGTAMDVTLLEWLNKYTYPEESKYKDSAYALKGYSHFVNDLINTTTTRIAAFATLHTDATLILMDLLQKAGFSGYVGKLGMNRNSPDYYIEKDEAIKETERWIKNSNFENIKPMITPRFTPSVTDEYMKSLGNLAKKYNLPMQSHLDENNDEIAWVKSLCPDALDYVDTYYRYGLFGGDIPTIMAHCIYCNEEENKLIKTQNVMIAHCPTSNENVIAGICPSAYYLRNGYRIGLGSDVAGGHTLNLFSVMASAVQVSKIRSLYIDKLIKPLTMNEAFFMATTLGGSFFGKVGLFEEGYEMDLVVIDDEDKLNPMSFSLPERIERLAYKGEVKIVSKYSAGRKIK